MSDIIIAKQAQSNAYNGISYKQLDCQAFVEKVLKDAKISNKNYRGSNDMARTMFTKLYLKSETVPPAGAIIFCARKDKGQMPSRYRKSGAGYDSRFPATDFYHVGIVTENGRVRHSSAGGVQYSSLSENRWSHFGIYGDMLNILHNTQIENEQYGKNETILYQKITELEAQIQIIKQIAKELVK